MSDQELVIGKLRAIGAIAPNVLTMVHMGTPIPWARARTFNGKYFTSKRTKEAEEALAWKFRAALARRPPFVDTVAIAALFYVPDFHQKDTDNCLKLVMDAATKAGIWRDDSQVKAHAVFLELDAANPRTVVAICPYFCSMSKAPLFTAAEERTV